MKAPKHNYYQGPAYFYTPEEKSYTVLQAYKQRILTSSEVKKFLFKDRVNVWTTWAFPVATFSAFHFSGLFNRYAAYKAYGTKIQYPLMASALLWLAWVNKNPFQDSLNIEKDRLLKVIENRVGVSMKVLNDVIPRFWTTQEIHRRTRQLYNERNSLFVDILYPSEEAMGPLFDPSTYSWRYQGDKLRK